MKRLISLMMALALVLSLSVSAFAENTNTPVKGSITISNATIGQTYRLFKIFNAVYEADENGNAVLDANGKPKVSYTINDTNSFYDAMFGADGKGTEYFDYNSETGVVSLKKGIGDDAVIKYLTDLIAAYVDTDNEEIKVNADNTLIAEADTVVFSELDAGYYVIDRGIKTAITIDSNTPNVTVIDKNQKPGSNFDKRIELEDGTLVDKNTANVGDTVNWQIDFDATRYNGKELVKYYTLHDVKSSSLWVEFNGITVEYQPITDYDENNNPIYGTSTALDKGYYFCATEGLDSQEWTLIGDGWTEEQKNNPNPEEYKDQANWYLIHYGYDNFEIVIPWLDDYIFEGVVGGDPGYTLTFDFEKNTEEDELSKPVIPYHNAHVVVKYSAAVGPDASLEGANNEVDLEWIAGSQTYGPEDTEKTETKVYNMGITKVANDGNPEAGIEATRLAGAVFELYRDEDCTEPVYVLKTNNPGVYILDDVAVNISGTNRITSRERYEDYNVEYLADATEKITVDGVEYPVRRDMTTPPVTGQLVILGLDKGTYYLKETKAPEGYNQLDKPETVIVGEGGESGTYNNNYVSLPKTENEEATSIRFDVYTIKVINNQGVELPSTGGAGTMMLITFGSVVAMAFAVLLITHKKMTVYQD